ncbi:uncharacterized protein EI97DRAFT_460237 [Westerdykella ornata]|uniref:Uncharacterized protein n=1 Tax=Westerdykella ornata TaxID=318751 RepID=A0A6A6JGN4_WESOR|nr:uncharacterized protein EI97DRAFT_460237 [Westerdykella ornata]KAF2274379.1 hypothetical protein EI97DRAFT_460237 [Westerdykella ornata]
MTPEIYLRYRRWTDVHTHLYHHAQGADSAYEDHRYCHQPIMRVRKNMTKIIKTMREKCGWDGKFVFVHHGHDGEDRRNSAEQGTKIGLIVTKGHEDIVHVWTCYIPGRLDE